MYPPEGFDVNQLLQNAQRMQQQFMAAQQDLADSEIVGSASGGLVRATVTGTGELVSLDIDRSVVDPDDTETLADLVVAAVRDASAEVQRLAAEQMNSIGQGLGDTESPGSPGAPGAAGASGAAGVGEDEMSISDRIAGLLGGRPEETAYSDDGDQTDQADETVDPNEPPEPGR